MNLGRPQQPVVEDPAQPLDEKDYSEQAFLRWLLKTANLDLSHYRISTLRRRLPACLRSLRASSVAQARMMLTNSPGLLPRALDSILIGVTGFFRDGEVFQRIERHLGELSRRGQPLRIWSAACSDGAELTSVAILMDLAHVLRGSQLVGTDCRPEAIEQARRGFYDSAAIAAVPPQLRKQYFVESPGGWRLIPRIHGCLDYRWGDIFLTPEAGAWDMILCRNLAIYLEPAACSGLWRRLQSILRPGGLLIVGKAERPAGAELLSMVSPCIYRRDRG